MLDSQLFHRSEQHLAMHHIPFQATDQRRLQKTSCHRNNQKTLNAILFHSTNQCTLWQDFPIATRLLYPPDTADIKKDQCKPYFPHSVFSCIV